MYGTLFSFGVGHRIWCLRGHYDLLHWGLGLNVTFWLVAAESLYDSVELVLEVGCLSVMAAIPLGFLTRYFKKEEA